MARGGLTSTAATPAAGAARSARTGSRLAGRPTYAQAGRLAHLNFHGPIAANHTGGREPSGKISFSENDVNGTTHRLSTPSQRRQWGEATLRTFVTPGSELRPSSANAGNGMPQRAIESSRMQLGAFGAVDFEAVTAPP